jgi:hypothetical protein
MDLQSLLTILLLTLILLVVVVVFVPAGLERRANHNRALRAHYTAEAAAATHDARRLRQSLARYRRARSAAYRRAATAAAERLADLDRRLAAAGALLGELSCPEIFDYALPAKHFVLFPRDLAAVATDTRQLARARSELQATAESLAAADTAVAALAALPERLAAEREALAARLDRVEETLRRERAAGIIALVDFDDDVARARAWLAEQAAVAADAPLDDHDAGALALEAAAPAIDHLEQGVAELTRTRATLDERLARAAAGLDDAQAGSKAGPAAADAPPAVGPLLRRAALLLNEVAPDHRRRRDFAAANHEAAAAERLIAAGRDLAAADRLARQLARRDDGVSLVEPIAAYRRDVDGALQAATGRAPSNGWTTSRLGERPNCAARAKSCSAGKTRSSPGWNARPGRCASGWPGPGRRAGRCWRWTMTTRWPGATSG